MGLKGQVGYPSDVTDEEWAFVLPYLLLRREDSPQLKYDLRTVFNEVRYVARTGGQWRFQSLYEGKQAIDVAPFGPFLVDLRNAEAFLQQLVTLGWGKGWGIFLEAEASFDDLRRHLRHFLIVDTEDGRQLLFRFYDPRVLRTFLPTSDAAQRAEFFGPITRFTVELPDVNTLGFFNL